MRGSVIQSFPLSTIPWPAADEVARGHELSFIRKHDVLFPAGLYRVQTWLLFGLHKFVPLCFSDPRCGWKLFSK